MEVEKSECKIPIPRNLLPHKSQFIAGLRLIESHFYLKIRKKLVTFDYLIDRIMKEKKL